MGGREHVLVGLTIQVCEKRISYWDFDQKFTLHTISLQCFDKNNLKKALNIKRLRRRKSQNIDPMGLGIDSN